MIAQFFAHVSEGLESYPIKENPFFENFPSVCSVFHRIKNPKIVKIVVEPSDNVSEALDYDSFIKIAFFFFWGGDRRHSGKVLNNFWM